MSIAQSWYPLISWRVNRPKSCGNQNQSVMAYYIVVLTGQFLTLLVQ
jgi:hypothetical protein